MNVDLPPKTLQETNEAYSIRNHNNKRKPYGQLKETETNKYRIIFPEYDLSTKGIGFGNGSNRVTVVAYKVKYHPAHSTILKYLLMTSSVLDPLLPSDTNIHFIPRGLIQSTNATIVKKTNHLTKLFLTSNRNSSHLQYS